MTGRDITSLKRLGGWKSTNVAEGYMEESRTYKGEVANKIFAVQNNHNISPSFNVSPMSNINYCQTNKIKIIRVENIQKNNTTSSHVVPMFSICTNYQITVNITKKNYGFKKNCSQYFFFIFKITEIIFLYCK